MPDCRRVDWQPAASTWSDVIPRDARKRLSLVELQSSVDCAPSNDIWYSSGMWDGRWYKNTVSRHGAHVLYIIMNIMKIAVR